MAGFAYKLAHTIKPSHAVNPIYVESMLRFFRMDREDSTFTGIIWDANWLHIEPMKLSAEFLVDRKKIQHFGTMHGGYQATAADCITCAALIVASGKAGVSTNLNMVYFDYAKQGELIRLDAEVLRFDNNFAYTEAKLYRMRDGAQLSYAQHTMARHPKAFVREETDRVFNLQ